MFEYISKGSSVIMAIVSVFKLAENTWIEDFFRWMYLGGLLNFIYNYYPFIMISLIVVFLSRWVKDWRWLLSIGVAMLLFFTFAF
jgi:hypothetical protein